jgi:hypothetical protein
VRLECRGIGVDFGVPSGDRVDAAGEGGDVVHAVDVAAEQIEAERAYADAGKLLDFFIGTVGRKLRDADPAGAELGQDVHQIGLIEGLERTRDDGAAGDAQRLGLGQVVGEPEIRRRIALVGDDRKAVVDDVAMAVEQATRHDPS